RPVQIRRRTRRKAVWIAAVLTVLVAFSIAVGIWQSRKHRWDFSPEVTRLVDQGDRLEWQGDTKRNLTDAEQAYRKALNLAGGNPLIQARLAALLARLEVQFPAP